MTLAAMLDLGVPREAIDDALEKIGVGKERLSAERVVKRGIAAVDVRVKTEGPLVLDLGAHVAGMARPEHAHGPGHEHHPYRDIRKQLERLEGEVKQRAVDMFERVARAEATLHGTTVDDVAFHEVGAIDSIVDIVGTAAALAWLAPASVSCVSVAMGSGTLKCAHGVLPVPAPAALEILRDAGGVITDGGIARELCTPTGAAILAHAVTDWGPAPMGTPLRVGWGAGDADLPDRANVLRLVLIRRAAASATSLWRVEANVDDISAEVAAFALERVMAAGATDAWWTAVTMKKGRPGLQLTTLVEADRRDAVVGTILGETTTIGVRFDRVERHVLARELVVVDTPYGPITVKVAREGARVINAAPEFEDCKAAALQANVPLKQVYAAAVAAWERSSQ
jgi:uncharacterized protein (TIGR00299 family) protein